MEAQHIQDDSLDTWAYVEVFGHTRLAGRVTIRKFGTSVMFQVDVPKGDVEISHSELFNPSAIFSIKPTTEDWCRKFVKTQRIENILPYIPEDRQLVHEDQGSFNESAF